MTWHLGSHSQLQSFLREQHNWHTTWVVCQPSSDIVAKQSELASCCPNDWGFMLGHKTPITIQYSQCYWNSWNLNVLCSLDNICVRNMHYSPDSSAVVLMLLGRKTPITIHYVQCQWDSWNLNVSCSVDNICVRNTRYSPDSWAIVLMLLGCKTPITIQYVQCQWDSWNLNASCSVDAIHPC